MLDVAGAGVGAPLPVALDPAGVDAEVGADVPADEVGAAAPAAGVTEFVVGGACGVCPCAAVVCVAGTVGEAGADVVGVAATLRIEKPATPFPVTWPGDESPTNVYNGDPL